jgi:hypothetical protein
VDPDWFGGGCGRGWDRAEPRVGYRRRVQALQQRHRQFALFAGFYVGAQVIERALEVISPLVPYPLIPWWRLPAALAAQADTARAAQVKADRAAILHGLAALLGVVFSCVFGLFFLAAVGMQGISHTVDSIITGFVIAGGVKPLHDFISYLQNRDNPTTSTGTTAG